MGKKREIFFLLSLCILINFTIIHTAFADDYLKKPLNINNISDICRKTILELNLNKGLPKYLLHTISIKESGRWMPEKKEIFAWPWTVTSGFDSKYYSNKKEAINAVKILQAKNIKNIDIGCMQINLKYHPKAFNSLEEAFEPANNITYASQFLKKLYKKNKSWKKAISYYHSSTPELSQKYLIKVENIWEKVRKIEARKKREQVIRKFNQRKLILSKRNIDKKNKI